jgi:hypothetical protein
LNDTERLNRIQSDLQKAGTVIYCEGKTDPQILFSLLGIIRPSNDIHDDTYVVGLSNGGSGSSEVQALLGVASANKYGSIYGIADGDGLDLSVLASSFDNPHPGPMFLWKGYCIENVLAMSGWPSAWGNEPDWQKVLKDYASYAALNRVHVKLRKDLGTLGLAKFRNPQTGQPLEQASGIQTQLEGDKALIHGRDVAAEFGAEYSMITSAIDRSAHEGHALINGKWFLRHLAPTLTGKTEEICRREWVECVQLRGGAAEIISWWERITGASP